MSYQEIHPHPALSSFIDAYWIVKDTEPGTGRILPDGCIDIIINLGTDLGAKGDSGQMKHDRAYLAGTMTRYIETSSQPDSSLVGIRFKPAAFSLFYRFSSLHEITDTTIEFDRKLAPPIYASTADIKARLDQFFLNRLTLPANNLFSIIDTIRHCAGNLSIDALAKQHAISGRQLERMFKERIGISPKEFASFTRYQSALQQIRQYSPAKSLSEIAFDCGYYDHAHLTNSIKQYTGLAPSRL